MLKLKNVSKFYYSKGVIASGFSKVNLELDMGEFVVITGESGSGKSTLLNVLSGLDTYEEGEMYIAGEETSHYNEADFEEYRRKYVGNIFQNFNLINSYTVYQNVELALLLNGEKKKDVKEQVSEIIAKVGLTEFSGTKCSKLSGGQKQRVAIARALAKETPIIVADEPTGNLDSQSAEEVMKILSNIAKDKLVIIVTHNLEQVEKYATRLIKMHDGKVLEDKVLCSVGEDKGDFAREFKDITISNRLLIGARNAFNIPTKLLLIFTVFLFIVFAVAGTYSSFQKQAYDESVFGWNNFFNDTSDERIIINKPDKSPITEEEFIALESTENVDRVVKDDIFIDYSNSISDEEYWYNFYGNFSPLKDFEGEISIGRMPEAPYEILVEGSKNDYYISQDPEEILESTFYLESYDYKGERDMATAIKIVGIVISEDDSTWYNKFYVGDEVFEALRHEVDMENSEVTSLFEGNKYPSYLGEPFFQIIPSDNVPQGKAYVSSDLDDLTSRGYCTGKEIYITMENLYHKESLSVIIDRTYNKNNFNRLLGTEYDKETDGRVYINSQDYNDLMHNGIFQSSVYVEDVKAVDVTVEAIKAQGFNTLVMRDSLSSEGEEVKQILSLIKTFVVAVLIIALFFISYFIIKIVLKSRNAYYTTIRTLGASKKISKQLLDIELFMIATIAYTVFIAVALLVYGGVITVPYIVDMAGYLTIGNYILMYVIIIGMSYMISTRFSKDLFKNSVMNTYRQEV